MLVRRARVAVSDFTVASGMDVAGGILDAAIRPTAVFACNDLLAIGTIQAARSRGIPVPSSCPSSASTIRSCAAIIDPALTTVGQPIRELGRQAVDLLHKQMSGEEPARQRVVLLPELVVRARRGSRSNGCLPVNNTRSPGADPIQGCSQSRMAAARTTGTQ